MQKDFIHQQCAHMLPHKPQCNYESYAPDEHLVATKTGVHENSKKPLKPQLLTQSYPPGRDTDSHEPLQSQELMRIHTFC